MAAVQRSELIDPPFGHPVHRIRWQPNQRFRTPVPAGLAPRLIVHLQGECVYRAGREVQEARPGDMCFDGGALDYVRQAVGMSPGELGQIAVPAGLTLPGPHSRAIAAAAAVHAPWRERFAGILPHGSAARDPVFDWHRRALLAAPAESDPASRFEAEARARQAAPAILEPLVFSDGRPRRTPEARIEILEALARGRADIAAQFIHETYRLPMAAELACLSPAYFSHLFHQLTGITAQAYLLGLRLEQAHLLLTHSGMSVADACYESGFRHLSHFAALFRRRFGLQPGQWRRESGETRPRFAVAFEARRSRPTPAAPVISPPPLYVRHGSALYLTYLALAHRGTAAPEALERLSPFVRRPDRRSRAVELSGVVCEGTGEAGVEALRNILTNCPAAAEQAPLALGDVLRGRPWNETASALSPYLTSSDHAPRAGYNAIRAAGRALRDTAGERFFDWLPALFRTGDGILDNLGVVTLGFVFRGSGHPRAIRLLSGCLIEGIARDVHDHTQSPACLCTASEALALVCRGTAQAGEAAERITPLLASSDPNNVYDGVRALCRLYTGHAPDGLERLLPFITEGRFPPLLALFDGASPARALPAIDLLWSHPSPMLRRTMAVALGLVFQGSSDTRARALLEDAVRRGAPKLAGDALLALGPVQHTGADDAFFALARGRARLSQPYLTRSALLAAGLGFQGSGHAEIVRWAEPFAEDKNQYVAAAAVQCLGLVGQGTRDAAIAARIQEASRNHRRLANDADQALLMVEFGVEALELLARWHGRLPCGQYASSSTLALRCFARRPGARWDVDEPLGIG